jgi:hypothetical protein
MLAIQSRFGHSPRSKAGQSEQNALLAAGDCGVNIQWGDAAFSAKRELFLSLSPLSFPSLPPILNGI